jgi:hypothetical protein
VSIGTITRSKIKKTQEKLIGLNQDVWVKKLQICQIGPSCTCLGHI